METASGWFESYKSWVRTHSKLLGAAEDALSHLTWVLPERFARSEVGLECFHSAMGVLSLWHDSITSGTLGAGPPWALVLGVIKQVEVLFEMRSNQLEALGKWNKYGPLAVLEMTKLLLRIFMFRSQGGRIALYNTESNIPQVSEDSPSPAERAPYVVHALQLLKEKRVSISIPSDDLRKRSVGTPPSMSRSQSTLQCIPEEAIEALHQDYSDALDGQNIPGINSAHSEDECWWETPACAPPPGPLSPPYSHSRENMHHGPELQYAIGEKLMLVGEIINLLRPMVYVVALGRYGDRAWRGWFISLSMDLLSHALIAKGSSLMRDSGVSIEPSLTLQDGLLTFLLRLRNFHWSPQEEDELDRRKRLLLLYLIRSPFFNMITRRLVWAAQNTIEPVPVLGSLGAKALEILFGVQNYYCYTSGS